MKILAIDIGVGTQDIMVYDDEKGFDNAYKLVLPSPTRILATELRRCKEDVVIFGDTMGGGPFTRAVLDHLKEYKVYMTESAARTLRDDLESVRNYGVEIIAEDEMEELSEEAAPIKISDLNLQLLTFLPAFGVDTYFDAVAIGVQDHGVAPQGVTDRENRFQLIEEKIESGIESFAYLDGVPENLSRMRSVYQSVKRWHEGHILLMDTGPAAILGSLEDERVKEKKKVVCINVGNAHTIAMSLNDREIAGVFEHHTGLLDKQKLENYIKKLSEGTITFKEVFDDGGHGALVRGEIQPEIISVTGPRRGEMKGLGIFAAPAGDMMMTGPVGLIKAVLSRL
ncbi:MAG TPA: DUF1786 domain-containing protein [Candidatus Bathyarchaeia archaeon]|nr:DUF1786 domain-containing protein [Candidatus Bathyarchaeia archaeon]